MTPIRFQPKCAATVKQFLDAQSKLVGALDVASITLNGRSISLDHVMEVGQVIVIAVHVSTDSKVPQNAHVDVSPTAPWTQPIHDPIEISSPPRKVSKFDVGECTIPKTDAPDQAWLDASPFMSLQGDQFLKLSMPSITTVQQLWSVRHQFFRTDDRLRLLEAQGLLMADDEMRFHLHALTLAHRDHQLRFAKTMTQVRVIDPLLATAWVQGKGFACALWAKDHPELKQSNSLIITAVVINHHWIPVFMSPTKDVLQVSTWDSSEACHESLNQILHQLALGLGFSSVLISREHRMFFTSTLCGSLAIAFLRSALIGALLATNGQEAEATHRILRERYCQTLHACQIVDRPWVWGAGDADPTSPPEPIPPAPALLITRDQRIDLINEKGLMMADDEIRFHIVKLIDRQETQSTLMGRTFAFFEPLVYNCWSSIGKAITEQWCLRHLPVRTQGLNIVTAFLVDEHWIPLWFSPRGNMLQVHTFMTDLSFTLVEEILGYISDYLDFRTFAIHRIPTLLPEHDLCGAHALAFLAHVIMNMPLPETVVELRTLHTNMRASFVAHLYSIEMTPPPVMWGSGLPGESGRLPRMPEERDDSTSLHASSSTSVPAPIVAVDSLAGESGPLPRMPAENAQGLQPFPPGLIQRDTTAALVADSSFTGGSGAVASEESLLDDRLLQVTSHSYAMADDEMFFQMRHLVCCLAQPCERVFLVVPPLHVIKWLDEKDDDFRAWIDEHKHLIGRDGYHMIVSFLFEHHWIPIWFAPCPGGLEAHTLANFAEDELLVDQILSHMAHKCGSALQSVHRVPHDISAERLCGAMTVCFFAHIMLDTDLPCTNDELYARCWAMETVFADALRKGPVTCPTAWGWGLFRESRPLPIMPGWAPFVAEVQKLGGVADVVADVAEVLYPSGLHDSVLTDDVVAYGMTLTEMSYHVESLSAVAPDTMFCFTAHDEGHLLDALAQFERGCCDIFVCALLCNWHWSPVLAWKTNDTIVLVVEGDTLSEVGLVGLVPYAVPMHATEFCGAATWSVLASVVLGISFDTDLPRMHKWLQSQCSVPAQCSSDDPVGFGPHGQLIKNLSSELAKHGVPPEAAEDRAKTAIKTLGSEQILNALGHRQPWRQLKMLGNNSKFQFVLPSELSAAVEANKGKPITDKGKGKGKSKTVSHPVDLDPSKLQVLEGTFRFQDRILPQLTMKQIGPVSSGFILMSLQDAAPYLKAGSLVSNEPLALVVLHPTGAVVQTALPHSSITVPCRCTLNNEPVLAEAVIVQVGQGLVEKFQGGAVLNVDTPEVVTLKVLVYKDELQGDWEEFCLFPIKCLVSLLPMLKRCPATDCQCAGWHNTEQLPIRDPILDVWRRQYLRQGFKPCPPAQAEFFSVCLRIPQCLLEALLAASGTSGAYCEPRTADGKEVLSAYTVVWTPKHTLQEMQHLMQTNPAVTGLARLGDRRGLRVRTAQAKVIHQMVRPDTVYLPNGPRFQYTAGPFPYGADRQAVGRILQTAGWECRPLQPSTPCPGRGVMWLIQSIEEPSQTIIHTTSGEIMITKMKQEVVSSTVSPTMVGSAATLALCGKPSSGQKVDVDPWTHSDLPACSACDVWTPGGAPPD